MFRCAYEVMPRGKKLWLTLVSLFEERAQVIIITIATTFIDNSGEPPSMSYRGRGATLIHTAECISSVPWTTKLATISGWATIGDRVPGSVHPMRIVVHGR